MQKLLKIGLLSLVGLLLSLICFMASTKTSCAMPSESLLGINLLPGLSMDVLPDATPTPTPVPSPTPTATQSPQATSTSQVSPKPTSTVLSGPLVKSAPASSKSTRNLASTVPTTGGAAIPVVITIHLPNAENLNIKIFKWFFILGIGAPLLLIGAGVLWLLIKRRGKQRRLALQHLID